MRFPYTPDSEAKLVELWVQIFSGQPSARWSFMIATERVQFQYVDDKNLENADPINIGDIEDIRMVRLFQEMREHIEKLDDEIKTLTVERDAYKKAGDRLAERVKDGIDQLRRVENLLNGLREVVDNG